MPWDFPGGPVVGTLPYNAGAAGSIPSQELRSHMTRGQKTKTENRNNIVINSIKTLKMFHSKKKSEKKIYHRLINIIPISNFY